MTWNFKKQLTTKQIQKVENVLRKILQLNILQVFYLSDSKTILHWIWSETRRFKFYVPQRVGETQDLINTNAWRYIGSKENVADEVARNVENIDFTHSSQWRKRPAFLILLTREKWPADNKKILENVYDCD